MEGQVLCNREVMSQDLGMSRPERREKNNVERRRVKGFGKDLEGLLK